MKKRIRFMINFIVCFLCFLYLVPATALADAEIPDKERTGSISVTIRDQKGSVGGGSLNLVKVAEVIQDNGNDSFAFTADFADCGQSLEGLETDRLSDPSLAAALSDWATANRCQAQVLEVDESGLAKADNLSIGLYLLFQRKASDGYRDISPFLVTIPYYDGESLVYDVDASPKPGTVIEESDSPDKPHKSEEADNPIKNGKLPQTGQLWWPIPILAFAGVLLFAIGWRRRVLSGV